MAAAGEASSTATATSSGPATNANSNREVSTAGARTPQVMPGSAVLGKSDPRAADRRGQRWTGRACRHRSRADHWQPSAADGEQERNEAERMGHRGHAQHPCRAQSVRKASGDRADNGARQRKTAGGDACWCVTAAGLCDRQQQDQGRHPCARTGDHAGHQQQRRPRHPPHRHVASQEPSYAVSVVRDGNDRGSRVDAAAVSRTVISSAVSTSAKPLRRTASSGSCRDSSSVAVTSDPKTTR